MSDVSVTNGESGGGGSSVRSIPLSYDSQDPHASALRLIVTLRPDWEDDASNLEFVRFKDGITNTLLKAVNKRNGVSKADVDKDAVLLRAYGHGTDVLIDRQREMENHELLMRHGLAPELFAHFNNGLLYSFIRGRVSSPHDMREPNISAAIARCLAEWHARVPCIPSMHSTNGDSSGSVDANGHSSPELDIDSVAPGKPAPNVWTVMQKWVFALPTDTPAQRDRQALLQKELVKLVGSMSQRPGLGKNGLVFAHCDLLSGNVIVLPKGPVADDSSGHELVSFIDYEYATPSPAAFDIANHFAEWGGFECDFAVLPTRAERRHFITEYIKTYFEVVAKPSGFDEAVEVESLMAEVDVFRGLPGFYWGIWALIQAQISDIEFDYASYAETRLGEYWAWLKEVDGSRAASLEELPLRERRWAQEE